MMRLTGGEAAITVRALRYHAKGLENEVKLRSNSGAACASHRESLRQRARDLRELADRLERKIANQAGRALRDIT